MWQIPCGPLLPGESLCLHIDIQVSDHYPVKSQNKHFKSHEQKWNFSHHMQKCLNFPVIFSQMVPLYPSQHVLAIVILTKLVISYPMCNFLYHWIISIGNTWLPTADTLYFLVRSSGLAHRRATCARPVVVFAQLQSLTSCCMGGHTVLLLYTSGFMDSLMIFSLCSLASSV